MIKCTVKTEMKRENDYLDYVDNCWSQAASSGDSGQYSSQTLPPSTSLSTNQMLLFSSTLSTTMVYTFTNGCIFNYL